MISRIRRALAALALLGVASIAGAAFPEKPITLIVPWAAGGSTDILARALAEQLTRSLGQPVIVDNRAGASGNIGSNVVAKAKPDGYTLLVGSMSTHAMNPALMPMPFKAVDDFTPIAQMANVVNTMVVNPSVPAKNLKELIAYAKANPGKLAYASAGSGSTNHLSAVLFEKAAGIQMLHVPVQRWGARGDGHRRQPDAGALLGRDADPSPCQFRQAQPAGGDGGEAFDVAAQCPDRRGNAARL